MNTSLFPTGRIIGGRYTVQALLAHRGWAATYSAIAAPNRELVLKVVEPTVSARPEASEVIRRMYAAANALGERHVLPILDSGRDAESGCGFLVTGQSPTPSLAQLVELCPLGLDETLVLARNTARLLDTAHAAGVVHLALKPSNVFVGPGPEYAVRLADFGAGGLRCAADPDEQRAFVGPWLAPEQAAAQSEERAGGPADNYALALLTFFALTGQSLRPGGDAGGALPAASLRARELGVTLPAAVDAVFSRALAVAPGDRFREAIDFVAALAVACGQQPPATEPRPAASPAPVVLPLPAPAAAAAPRPKTPAAAFAPVPAPIAAAAPAAVPPPLTAAPAFPVAAPAPAAVAAFPAPAGPGSPPPIPQAPALAPAPVADTRAAAPPASPIPEPAPSRPLPAMAVPSVADAAGADDTGAVASAGSRRRRGLLIGGLVGAAAIAVLGVIAVTRSGSTAIAPLPPASTTTAAALSEPSPPPEPPSAPSPAASTATAPAATAPAASATAPPATAPAAAVKPIVGTGMRVVCEPECDLVLLNGKPMTAYPDPVSLPPGTYGVGVSRKGYGGQYRMLKLRPGQQETVRFTLNEVRSGGTKKPCGKFLKRCD